VSAFPRRRMRRLRQTPALRSLWRETRLSPSELISPLFVVGSDELAGDVAAMPGVSRLTVDELDDTIERLVSLGVGGVMLFGVPGRKDASGFGAFDQEGVVPRAIAKIQALTDRIVVIADVCLCGYTGHGHCGILTDGGVDNDATLEVLAKAGIAYANAGADIVAPSAMMDGQVAAIRAALDDAGHSHTAILSYAAKYASSFYGPFRDAAHCAPQFGDRKQYQMAPSNAAEAVAEARLDVGEGADAITVKPAGPCLDVIRRVRDALPDTPCAAYQVSGEFSMIKAASDRGWLDERGVAIESLIAIKRAGASPIITYFARQAAQWLPNSQ